MIKKVIQIDEERCVGCGLCVNACHQGAIALADGKAKVVRNDYCDGLGMCLPVCPVEAISFSDKDISIKQDSAPAYSQPASMPKGCPGSLAKFFAKEAATPEPAAPTPTPAQNVPANEIPSQLNQWPVQIKLMPTSAAFYNNADLLIAADCAAYAYGNFHNDFMKGKTTLVGCPKLDEGDYTEKLTTILQSNMIKSVTVARMEVPCCGGIERAALSAAQASGKNIPCDIVMLSLDGKILPR